MHLPKNFVATNLNTVQTITFLCVFVRCNCDFYFYFLSVIQFWCLKRRFVFFAGNYFAKLSTFLNKNVFEKFFVTLQTTPSHFKLIENQKRISSLQFLSISLHTIVYKQFRRNKFLFGTQMILPKFGVKWMSEEPPKMGLCSNGTNGFFPQTFL